jgi:uncharacterized protein
MTSTRSLDPSSHDTDAVAAWQDWHSARIRSLQAPQSWLTLVGLHFLDPTGTWTVGTDPLSDIPVAGRAARHIGTLRVDAEGIQFASETSTASSPLDVTVDGHPVDTVFLHDDSAGSPSIIRSGSVTIAPIRRNGQLALRIRDDESPTRLRFHTIGCYDYDPRLRLTGTFTAAASRTTIAITNVTGFVEEQALAGTIRAALGDAILELAVTPGHRDGSLFLVFADHTNGRGTYPRGRFLDIEPPNEHGAVVLDFNRSYNPACAFTAYATCPTPPANNRIPFAIAAGERYPPIMKTDERP